MSLIYKFLQRALLSVVLFQAPANPVKSQPPSYTSCDRINNAIGQHECLMRVAIRIGDIERMRSIIRTGYLNPTYTDQRRRRTWFQEADFSSVDNQMYYEIVTTLIELGSDVNQYDLFSITSKELDENTFRNLIDFLISNGINLNRTWSLPNRGTQNILMYGDGCYARDSMARLNNQNYLLSRAIDMGVDVNFANEYGLTPLMTLAELGGDTERVCAKRARMLIESGARISMRDVAGRNAADWTRLYRSGRQPNRCIVRTTAPRFSQNWRGKRAILEVLRANGSDPPTVTSGEVACGGRMVLQRRR